MYQYANEILYLPYENRLSKHINSLSEKLFCATVMQELCCGLLLCKSLQSKIKKSQQKQPYTILVK